MTKTAKPKVRRQPPLVGGRVPSVGMLDPEVEAVVLATARKFRCSRSWVINEMCAIASEVEPIARYDAPAETTGVPRPKPLKMPLTGRKKKDAA